MKILLLAFLSITLTCSNIVKADGPIGLNALTGEQINIWFGTKKDEDNGNTAATYAYGVHIKVDGGISGVTRVIFINSCTPSNSLSYRATKTIWNCGYAMDGTWVNSRYCTIQGEEVFADGSTFLIWAANHGGQLTCTQQIAISPTVNNWLVDPINGEHNFNFSLPRY